MQWGCGGSCLFSQCPVGFSSWRDANVCYGSGKQNKHKYSYKMPHNIYCMCDVIIKRDKCS